MQTETLQNQPSTNQQDIYQQVTDTIIQQLEAGTIPWQQPWAGPETPVLTLPENSVTGNPYRGINIVLLWCSAMKNSFSTSEWGSFNQWQSKKEFVRKGEKGSLVVYYDTLEKEVDGEIKKIPFLKRSYVFNRCQLQSYVPEKSIASKFDKPLREVIDPVEDFIAATGALVEHGGNRAYYDRTKDKIVIPQPEFFEGSKNCTATEGYYSTILHELTHWTGIPERLNREKGKSFGDKKYAHEELVAELGSAFLCAGFGMATIEKGEHAAYIDCWLKVLKENKYCIVNAASAASKAVDYLYSFQI